MKDIYFIISPFQLMTAIATVLSRKNDYKIIAIKTNNQKGNKQMELLQNEFNVKVDFSLQFPKNIILRFIRLKKYVKDLNKDRICNLYIGDYRLIEFAIINANLKANASFLLDDGGATNTVQDVFERQGNIFKENQNHWSFKKVLIKIIGLKIPDSELINLHTIYELNPLPNQQITRNNIKVLSKHLRNHEESIINQNIFFVGSSMVENGIIESQIYFNYLKEISNYFKSTGKDLIYLPHRVENNDKIEKIKSLGYNIEHSSFPLELEFLIRKINPLYIASFFSTALYTLNKLYPKLKIYSFKIPEKYINDKYKEHLKSLYKSTESIAETITLKS